MLKKIIYGILIVLGIGIIGICILSYMISDAFGLNDKSYTISELKENFDKNKNKINELINYYDKIVPKNKIVEIEFEDDKTISRLGIYSTDSTKSGTNFLDWNLQINSKKTDSIIQTINWNTETLSEIKRKLDNANCIQIKNGEPTQIGFKRSGMGMYFFNVFKTPINQAEFSMDENFNNCNYRYVDRNLVLEYGGGAIGPQCFPQNQR